MCSHQELHCGALDATGGRSVLQVIQEYLSEVMLPALQHGQKWGTLEPHQIEDFMSTLRAYIQFLKSESTYLCFIQSCVCESGDN